MGLAQHVLALVVRSLRRFRLARFPVRLFLRAEMGVELAATSERFGFAVNIDRSGHRVDPVLTFRRWDKVPTPLKEEEPWHT